MKIKRDLIIDLEEFATKLREEIWFRVDTTGAIWESEDEPYDFDLHIKDLEQVIDMLNDN